MELRFQLTGALLVDNPGGSGPFQGAASVDTRIYVQSGVLFGNGGFGSFSPYSLGSTTVKTELIQGGTPTTTVTPFGPNATDYAFEVLPNGEFRMSLGSSFFSNPANPDLYLDLNLFAAATLYAYENPTGPALQVSSDYSHTFRMTSISAFDGSGSDITQQAGLSFVSSTLPVPEPGTGTMLAAGLALGMLRLGRGRSNRSSH